MAGHGGLCQRIFHCRCESAALGFLCALLLLAQTSLATAQLGAVEPELIDARFRLQWTSTDERYWKVQIVVAGDETGAPSIQDVINLSSSEHTTGAIELSPVADGLNANSLTVQPRHTLHDGAVQFRVRGSSQAKLSIRVLTYQHRENSSISRLPTAELSLAEIVERVTIDSGKDEIRDSADGTNWTLTRVEGDGLRIEGIPSDPTFEPSSELNFSVRCNSLVDQASRPLTLRATLIRVADGATVSSHQFPIKVDPRGNSEPVAISEAVPALAGVYEIRCQLVKEDENIWTRLRRRDPPVLRVGRPILVRRKSRRPVSVVSETWREVGQIRPSESTWSVGQWIPQSTSRLIPGSESDRAAVDLASETYSGESVSLIKPRSSFQATLPVLTPGIPHRVTIRFPDDRPMRLRVDIAPSDQRDLAAASFVLTHRPKLDHEAGWRSHSFVHYPRTGEQIWLTNLDDNSAAFESISVRAGPSHLTTAIKPVGSKRQAVLRLVDTDWVDSLTPDVDAQMSGSDWETATVTMHKTWIAVDRLVDYLLASGMNGVMVPIDGRSRRWSQYASLLTRRESSSLDDPTSLLMRMMEGTNLGVTVALRPTALLSGPERAMRQQPTLVRELTRVHLGNNAQYNLLHPAIQTSLASWVGYIDQQYSEFACFSGIALLCHDGSHLQPLTRPEHDPGTLARFAQSKGMPPASAQQRRAWVTQQGKPMFDAWLQDETRKAYLNVARAAKIKPVLMVTQVASDESAEQTELKSLALVDGALVDDALASGATLVPARSFRYGSDQVLAKNPSFQQQLSLLGPPGQGAAIAAMLGTESYVTADQPFAFHQGLVADLSRILDRLDPEILVVEQRLVAGQLNEDLSQLFDAFTSLPAAGVQPFPSPDAASQTVRLRSGTQDGFLFVSMISLVPWASEVELETSSPAEWVVNGQPQDSHHVSIQPRGGNRVRLVIPAGQMMMLRSKAPTAGAVLRSWSSRVSGGPETLKQIKQQVTLIVERIGALSEFAPHAALTNGGFEQSGGMGLVGWLHAQHPPGCVRVDDKEHVEGEQSVLLTTDPSAATRTWIVSEMIDPPVSGRLAVSLACRGEMKENAAPHRLKVSLEATRDRQPIRFSNEFEVPRNGQWGSRDVVLEADGIDPQIVDSLRLTIDSLSGGRVWIDDVQLHDQFATEQERDELQSLAFLAVQGLQRGNLAPSGRLLQNHWARHLLALQPTKTPKSVIENKQPPPEAPGVAERFRSWLPRPLRF